MLRIVLSTPLPSQSEMRSRLRELRLNPEVRKRIQTLASNTGLVLSGGGGKGAYQIGCLRALSSFGISHFSAISGTSVGALNAALIAQGDLPVATRIWSKIKFGDVLKAHPFGFSLAFILRLLLTPIYLLQYALRKSPDFIEAVGSYRSLVQLGYSRTSALSRAVSLFIMPALFSCLGAAFATAALTDKTAQVRVVFLKILLILVVVIVLWASLQYLQNFLSTHFSFLSNDPLEKLLKNSLKPARIREAKIPVIVTMTTLGWILKKPEKAFPLNSPYYINKEFAVEPRYDLRYIPVYVELASMTDDQIIEQVLQSAALPEVFPQKVIKGKPVVDGGVADNVPLLPIMQRPEVANVIAIYLKNNVGGKEFLRGEQHRLNGLREDIGRSNIPVERAKEVLVKEFAELTASTDNEQRTPATQQSKRILCIVPSRSLGGLLTGTMNFSSCKARRLMWLGYWDTLSALKNDFGELYF